MLVTLGFQGSNRESQWTVIMLKSKKRKRREGKLFFTKYSAGRIVNEETRRKGWEMREGGLKV